MSLHSFTRYIFINVYTESCHCTANCKFQHFSTPEPYTPKLRSLNVLSAVGNTGSPTLEIVADVRSIFSKTLVPVKNDRYRTRDPTIIVTKTYNVCVGVMPLFAYNLLTARFSKRSVGVRFLSGLELAMLNQTQPVNERPVLRRVRFACTSKRPLCDLMHRFT